MNEHLISVIIPVYNTAEYLPRCLDSILNNTYRNLEVICINDGSKDSSLEVLNSYAAKDPRVKVIDQENAGVSAARNRGIREAAGEYLLFIDSDDTVDTQLLDRLLNDFPGTGADLAIFGICFDYYHHGKQYRSDLLAYAESGLLDSNHWSTHFAELFEVNGLSSVWAKIFRKQIIAEHGLFFKQDMFLYEDLEYVLRYAAHCGSIYNDPRGIYHYRQSEDEGNAGRRLKRIDRLSEFMKPLETAMEAGTPIISCMGTGNKLDPTRFTIADIYSTSVCPLCKVMRKELKERNIPSLKVLYSTEVAKSGQRTPQSIAFCPSVAGILIAREVVLDLIKGENDG